MSKKIDELCTVVLPTFFPGNEIFENIKSIPSELNILIIDTSYQNRDLIITYEHLRRIILSNHIQSNEVMQTQHRNFWYNNKHLHQN